MLTYGNSKTFTWEHGRELSGMTDASGNWSFAYNVDGLRVYRSNGTVTYKYYYSGDKLSRMAVDYADPNVADQELTFGYDANGAPQYVIYGGHRYFYLTNLQGDVTAIITVGGTTVVKYTYDAWGNILTVTGGMANTLGKANPLRYRGYIYDEETRLYYLQSRYYDPELGRFINADDPGYLGADGTPPSYNFFAYCGNNPVMGYDPTGHWSWGWKDQLALGAGVLMIGLALLLAPPTGGASLGALTLSASTIAAAGSTMAFAGTVITGDAVAQATVNYAKQSKKSGKERSTDKPSWVSPSDVDLGKSSQQNATDMLNNKYGSGNWNKGPRTEFYKIVKWIDRGLKTVVIMIANTLMEE